MSPHSVVCFVIASFLSAAFTAIEAAGQELLPSPGSMTELIAADDGEALLHGPVHEAFAEQVSPNPTPGFMVTQAPPEAIEELPPEVRPEGERVEWISGYWAWDDDREDFIWVSGLWRKIPPGVRWLPGYWTEAEGGFQWVAGTWIQEQRTDLDYIAQSPPETLELGPVGNSPSTEHFWVPGNWTWQETRYAWTPGFWTRAQTNWVWVPTRYLYTPRGYVYCQGYWDYPLAVRGSLFAPYWFNQRTVFRPGYYFRPRVLIALDLLPWHFWVRPGYSHYYFGDYYAARYRDRGILPWHSYYQSSRGIDPLFSYYDRYRGGNNVSFYQQINQQYNFFVNQEDLRPPRSYRDQIGRGTDFDYDFDRRGGGRDIGELALEERGNLRFGGTVEDWSRRASGQLKNVSKVDLDRYHDHAVDVREMASSRRIAESSSGGRSELIPQRDPDSPLESSTPIDADSVADLGDPAPTGSADDDGFPGRGRPRDDARAEDGARGDASDRRGQIGKAGSWQLPVDRFSNREPRSGLSGAAAGSERAGRSDNRSGADVSSNRPAGAQQSPPGRQDRAEVGIDAAERRARQGASSDYRSARPIVSDAVSPQDGRPGRPNAGDAEPGNAPRTITDPNPRVEDRSVTETRPIAEDRRPTEGRRPIVDQPVAGDRRAGENRPVGGNLPAAEDRPTAEDRRAGDNRLMPESRPTTGNRPIPENRPSAADSPRPGLIPTPSNRPALGVESRPGRGANENLRPVTPGLTPGSPAVVPSGATTPGIGRQMPLPPNAPSVGRPDGRDLRSPVPNSSRPDRPRAGLSSGANSGSLRVGESGGGREVRPSPIPSGAGLPAVRNPAAGPALVPSLERGSINSGRATDARPPALRQPPTRVPNPGNSSALSPRPARVSPSPTGPSVSPSRPMSEFRPPAVQPMAPRQAPVPRASQAPGNSGRAAASSNRSSGGGGGRSRGGDERGGNGDGGKGRGR